MRIVILPLICDIWHLYYSERGVKTINYYDNENEFVDVFFQE